MQRHRNSLRTFLGSADARLQHVLEPRRFIRWLYLGRLTVATAIYVAAVFVWQRTASEDTLVASLTFATAVLFTAASAFRTEVQRASPTEGFLYLQLIFDVVVVTAVVHVTGNDYQFAALYILVNACAAVLLPVGGALLVAILGSVLYVADVLWAGEFAFTVTLVMQLVVFVAAAVGTAYIGNRLRAMSAGTAELAAELAQARVQAADILRNIRSGVLTVDARGILRYVNPSASELLGEDFDALIGQPVLPRLHAVAPVVAAAIDRAVAQDAVVSRREGVVERDGRRFPVGVTTTASAGDGTRVGRTVTAIFQDISDQKRIEQLHLRAQRLEAVAELSASLAHEIKNPLAAVRSAVEQLARRPAAGDDERRLGDLIVKESDRLSRLLSEFLDFARVRVARIEPVDLAAIARGAVHLAGQHPDRAPAAPIECVTPPDPVRLDGDEDLLHRAVFNLALNAVQAAPRGRVRVEVAAVPPGDEPAGVPFDGGAVVVRVTDDGPGIPAEIRDRLFEPFTTTKPGGSGLGLPIVHRAIEAHRGLILVDSDAGGTRFSVFLPRRLSDPDPGGAT
jgi:two-component system sensor histidine kinase PilS (NtrC family)